MLKNFIIAFLIIAVFLLTAILAVRTFPRTNLSYDAGDELALADNSLINRFNRVEEKYTPPAGPVKLSNDEGRFLKLSANGRELYYYLPETGQIKSALIPNLTRRDSPVSSLIAEIKPGFKEISWSKDGRGLIAANNQELIYYDLPLEFSEKLDSKINRPVFSSDGNIAFLYSNPDTGESEIRISDSRAENYKDLLNTRLKDWQIAWIGPKTLSLTSDGSLFTLDTDSGDLTKILAGKSGLMANWSQNGEKLLYSSAKNGNFPELRLYRVADQWETTIKTSAKPSDCVWSVDGVIVYCPASQGLELIDTTANTVTILSKDSIWISAEELVLSGAEDYLLFRNGQTGKIYSFYLIP